MSLVAKEKFITAVSDAYIEFYMEYKKNPHTNKKLMRAVDAGVERVRNDLVWRAKGWLLPVVPSVLFIRHISKDLWFHVYSDKFEHKFHNTVNDEKGKFLREVRFKLHGTRNL